MRNRYLNWLDNSREPLEWNPAERDEVPVPDCAFLGDVFRSFEESSEMSQLTFVLTRDSTRIAVEGPDVVAVLLADEWARTPFYVDKVGAVLKTMGSRLGFPLRALWPPSAAGMASLGNYARIRVERSLWRARSGGMTAARGDAARRKTIEIPLGYYRQRYVPWKDWNERSTDLFFAGSLAHDLERRSGLKRIGRAAGVSPKTIHRRRMVEAVERVGRDRPNMHIALQFTGDFHGLSDADGRRYSETLMDTKLCLAPQGSSIESYRLFEGLRFGCIVVCEHQPRRWYYADAPFLRLRDWAELPEIVDGLVADPDRQLQLHRAGLAWWRDVCSGEAVGRKLAVELPARLGVTHPLERAIARA